jgi:hypothetical protein
MTFKSFQQVQNYIDNLPKVAEGHTRLFRGQTSHYDQIISSAHRGEEVEGRAQWNQYCSLLAHDLALRKGDKLENIAIILYWVEILSQHYGSGSEFLDVTKSVNIAIWFALNKCERVERQFLSGEQGDPSPNDIITINQYLTYSHSENNGVIYVLDIPEALNDSFLDRRTAINLSEELQSIFEGATRIKVQEASVVRCDPNVNKGDVSNFLACDPIHIAPSCLDGIGDEYTSSYLFPSPEIDIWYDHFCKVPYSLCAFSDTGQMAGKRSIPVEFYVNNQKSFELVQRRVVTRNPFNYYLQNPQVDPKDREEYDEATPILLDNPVLLTSSRTRLDNWNEALLWKHADLTTVKDPEKISTTKQYCTSNTFYEFSPLEYADWQGVVDKTEDAFHTRALWLRIYNGNLIKAEFYIDDYDTDITADNWQDSFKKSYLECYFDEEKNAIVFNTPEKKLLTSFSPIANAIYTVLTIMGDCRPGVTIKPFPAAIIEHMETKRYSYRVIATDTTMTLKPRLSVPTSGVDFYGVYHKETKKTYHSTGAHLEKGAIVSIDSHVPFCLVSPEEIIKAFVGKYGEIW